MLEPLEGLGHVAQAKGNPAKLAGPERRGDGGFLHILGGHLDLVVASDHVYFWKNFAPDKKMCEVLQEGDGILIWHDDVVEALEIATWPEPIVFFASNVEGRGPR